MVASMSKQLAIDTGQFTSAGIKPHNEDSVGFFVPEDEHQLRHKGICGLVADGVSTAEAGKQASELCVKYFISDYYRTPEPWTVQHSGENILAAVNSKLYKLSDAYRVEGKGFLCTFSAVVVKSRTAHLFHVGDSRIYVYRNHALTQLTQDHTVFIGNAQAVLSRAVGMDTQIHVDYQGFALEEGDILLCTSDGVHDFVNQTDIEHILNQPISAQQKATLLGEQALRDNSDDNISAVVMHIQALDDENINEFNARLTRLPFPPDLEPGMVIDDFEIISEVYASSRSQLYKVKDRLSGDILVMKTPSINFEHDNHYIDRFIQEEWLGKRIDSPYVVKVINANREKHFLYYLLEWVEGCTLSEWMRKQVKQDVTLNINIVEQIAQGLRSFHANECTHQDLRPSNIMINPHNKIKIVDFGSVFVAGLAEVFRPIMHDGALGTASYADPLYLQGKNSGIQGDLYSLGTIAYELFTGHLPYGDEIEDCTEKMAFDKLRYKSASKYNAVIPQWFDRALEKSVKFELSERYRNMRDFIADLKYPNANFLRNDPKVELTKSPLLFWQMLSVFWIVMLFLMVMLFS